MTDSLDLPQKLIDYSLNEWWPNIKTVREKLCEPVPDVPGLFLIERKTNGRPDVWIYGCYMILATGHGDGMDEIVNAGYFWNLDGVGDLRQDIDGLPLGKALERIRVELRKSKDYKEWLAK